MHNVYLILLNVSVDLFVGTCKWFNDSFHRDLTKLYISCWLYNATLSLLVAWDNGGYIR